MKEIQLTQDQVALVDDDDYIWLSQFKWSANRAQGMKYVAMRMGRVGEGKCRPIYMAREILGLYYGDELQAHHLNHDTLDNRRGNLRIVSSAENKRHQPSRGGSSRYVGVTWDRHRNKWRAQIQVDGKGMNLGRYATEHEAATARDNFVRERETGHAINLPEVVHD